MSPPEKKLEKSQNTPLRINADCGRLCGVETTTGSTLELWKLHQPRAAPIGARVIRADWVAGHNSELATPTISGQGKPLTTNKRIRRGDTGGTVERIYWGKMVSDNVQRFRGEKTLHKISRDMGKCILHLPTFRRVPPLHQRGRAITQFPRKLPRGQNWQ